MRIIIIAFIYCCIVLGFLIRCTEYQASQNLGTQQSFDFRNSVWICFITMSSVGYGELSPISMLGKIVTVICAFMGVLITAGMVLGTLTILEMDHIQSISYMMINSVNIKDHIKVGEFSFNYLSYILA